MKTKNTQIIEYLEIKIGKEIDKNKGKKIIENTEGPIDECMKYKDKMIERLKYIGDEQSHLIRTLANLTKLSDTCMNIAYEEKLVHSLLLLFPSPKEEIGEITPKSVILPPKSPAPALLLGNAARCLLPFGEDLERNGKLLYDIRGVTTLFSTVPCNSTPIMFSNTTSNTTSNTVLTSTSIQAPSITPTSQLSTTGVINPSPIGPTPIHSIERLICGMATCSDIRVRRNISIILAKGCKVPGVRDHVEKYRGMQIMIELQKLL